LGIDIGSTSVKYVLLDGAGQLLDHDYRYARGNPAAILLTSLHDLSLHHNLQPDEIFVGITGSGSHLLAAVLGATRVNELVAQTYALEKTYPQARTAIEMGGQDSKLLQLEPGHGNGALSLANFAMNTLCAAGTGSYLDQQAERLGLSIESFSNLALQAQNPARIAGRCTVFAKSDLVHLGQQGTPLPDIVAGLCLAVARNLRATLIKGHPLQKPIIFQGGVARNAGMIWAFEQILELESGQLIIPTNPTLMAALGAALGATLAARTGSGSPFRGLATLADFARSRQKQRSTLPPLLIPKPDKNPKNDTPVPHPTQHDQTSLAVYLGVDVGSVSTKAVALDEQSHVLADCYLPTANQPLTVVQQALEQIHAQVGEQAHVVATGVTGSGRYPVAKHLGSEQVFNEIAAQARSAMHWDADVDTVFEIGGQDSKFISLNQGAIKDMTLNKACAAGTGAFLEEQAGRLKLSVVELGRLAFESNAPADLGERCTVFVEADLVHHQQQGALREDLAAGLAYAVARNYLARVVQPRPVGEHILFQGGVALNPAVVAAFEALLERPLTVPPRPELQGAVGAALLAMATTRESRQGVPSQNKVSTRLPDLFAEREALLLASLKQQQNIAYQGKIGIPYVLTFHELLPYWIRFFQELDWEVVLSPPTTTELATRSVTQAAIEACYPVKLVYGHVQALITTGVDQIFLPGLVNRRDPLPGQIQSYHCPYIQAIPQVVAATWGEEIPVPVLWSPIHFLWPQVQERELRRFASQLNVSVQQIEAARRAAEQEQLCFETRWRQRGREILAALPADQTALVVVGRMYSSADPILNTAIPARLRDLGVLAMPHDLLSLDKVDIASQASNMFWYSGQRILATAEVIRRDPRLQAIYLTHFGCGPDSFLLSFFRQALNGKPFLEIELDDHSGDAGLITRLEAFVSLVKSNSLPSPNDKTEPSAEKPKKRSDITWRSFSNRRTLVSAPNVYIANICDPAHVLVAAMRSFGLQAEVLPPSTIKTLNLGRDLALGRECLPFYTIVGDLVQRARQPDFDPARAAYLIPTSAGPCRLGQFHDMLELILKRQGLGSVRIIAPSAENGYQYSGLGVPPLLVGRRAWQGLLGISVLEKLLHHHRPYEIEPGSAERLYLELLADLVGAVENGGGARVIALVDWAGQCFANLPIDRGYERPLIGLIGELYLRLNPFTNQDLIRRVEALGGEIWLAPMSEWIYYVNSFSRFSTKAERRYFNLLRLGLIRQVLSFDESRILAPIEKSLYNAHEPSTSDLLTVASPYFHPELRTETPLTIGKAIDFFRHGADGILNAMPFTCMPGTVVAALAGRIRSDCEDVPWLDMIFDGLGQTHQQTRLEAFMYQAEQFRANKTRKNGSNPSHR
jgi:predicted CoA-substrate-specific enzyme activase